MDRIQKFHDDSKSLLSKPISNSSTSPQVIEFLSLDALKSGSAVPKIVAEINRLRTWIQKHQSESVTDGAKTKLFATVEGYFKFFTTQLGRVASSDDPKLLTIREQLHGVIHALIGDYLQLPEGKLLSGRDKKKALTWIDEMVRITSPCAAKSSVTSSIGNTLWVLQGINPDGTILLLNSSDCELWKENFRLEKATLQAVRALQSEVENESLGDGDSFRNVFIELDEADRFLNCFIKES